MLPCIFGLINCLLLTDCWIDVRSAVAQLGGGGVRGTKKGIADGQLVLISGRVYDKGARWH